MLPKIRNHPDFWSGVMFMVAGAGFAAMAIDYEMGSSSRMGPGWFPTVLGLLLLPLGFVLVIRALGPRAPMKRIGAIRARESLLVLGSVAAAALLVPVLGMVIAMFLLVFLAALASREFRLGEALIGAILLVAVAYALFVRGLGVQFPVWPVFIGS